MKKWLIACFVVITTITTVYASNNTKENRNADDAITIYFARHGKTILNTMDRVQGIIDSPLTAEGRAVTVQLGEGLKGIPFDNFYTSDAGRQRETMQILLAQMKIQATPIEDVRLREVNFGGFEGGFNKDMALASAQQLGFKDGGELFAKMRAGEIDPMVGINSIAQADPSQSGETAEQVKARTQSALRDMVKTAQANGEKNILAVSSGSSMQIMISDLTDNPDKNKPLSNATIIKIIYQNGQFTVTEIGNKEYINAGKRALGEK